MFVGPLVTKRRCGRWERLYKGRAELRLNVLERLLSLEQDESGERVVLMKLAQTYAELSDIAGQMTIARRLRGRHLSDEAVFKCVEEIYLRLKQYAEVCEVYEARISVLNSQRSEPTSVCDLLRRKARLQADELASPAEAADTYLRLLELSAGDEETLHTLENILRELSDWPRLMLVYERHAMQLKKTDEKVSYLQRAAKIAHYQLKDEAEAYRLYEQIHHIDPTDPVAFSALERRLERQADHKRLTKLLLDRARRSDSQTERVSFLVQAASACEGGQDIEGALSLYKEALAAGKANLPALEALARIYESQERWRDFLDVTQKQLELQRDPARKALLYFKCGSVVETQFHDEEKAYEFYSQAVKSSANCLPALHGLRDLQAKRSDWEAVAKTLAAEVRVWSDMKGRADVLAQLGEIYELQLGERAKALECYQRAIKTHAECMRAALALFRIYANERNYQEAAQWGRIYARRGHLRGDPSERVQFFVQWGEVLLAVHRPKEATGAVLRALELDPANHGALYHLLRLCRFHHGSYEYDDVVNGLQLEPRVKGDAKAAAILAVTSGVLREHGGDVDGALSQYREGIRLGGHRIQLVRPLADLLVLIGETEPAIELVRAACIEEMPLSFDHWVECMQWLGDHYIENGQYERAERCFADILEKPAKSVRGQKTARSIPADVRAPRCQSARIRTGLANIWLLSRAT